MATLGRLLLALTFAVALGSSSACHRHDPTHARAATVARVLDTITRQYPNPVSVSPAGDRVLVKSMLPDRFDLVVLDRRTGARVAADVAVDTQLAPTWRADGGALAFFAAVDGRLPYVLRVWPLDGGSPRVLRAATSPFAAVRWAPSGARVAYLDGDLRRAPRRLVVVDTEAADPTPRILLDGVAPATSFVWSAAGDLLATVLLRERGAIAIVPADGGAATRLAVVPGGEVHGLAWSPDGKTVLAAGRAPRAEYFALFAVDRDSGGVRALATPEGDVSAPLYRPDGRGILYHVNVDGEVAVVAAELDGRGAHVVSPPGGVSTVTGFAPSGAAAYVLHVGRVTPPVLYETPLDGGGRTVVFGARPVPELAIEGEHVDVPAAHSRRDATVSPPGGALPAYLWRGRAGAAPRPAVVVRVHGGPQAQFLRSWEVTTELLASEGYHVLALNYRGSTGYGATFEQQPVGDRERVADVLAARDYAVATLGVPAERVFLLGQSYGALLAAEAAAADPDALGGAILLSLVGAPARSARRGRAPARVLAFHGDRDDLSAPADARRTILDVFGAGVFDRPAAGWRVFDREPHSYTRMRTWAEVYAAVLEALDGG